MGAWTCIVTGLIFLVGLLVGAVLGLNGFGQPATPGAIGQSPRIKNLLWLFSGFLPALLLDFKKLGLPQDYPLYWPVGGYGAGACLGAIGAIGWMVHSITRSVRAFNQQHPAAPIDAGELQREYLTYGKSRFEERWHERKTSALKVEAQLVAERHAAAQEQTAAEAAARREAAATEERRALDLEADKLIARCVYAALGHLALTEAIRKSSEGALLDTIMDAILKVVSVHAGTRLVLRGSYMAYIPAADANRLRDQSLFTSDMPDHCVGYLQLRRGGGLPVRKNIVLPVAAETECVLPGAPEAVAVMGIAIMNLREVGFRARVSQAVRREIQEYFRDPYFETIESATSLVVQDGEAVLGVMNIESSAPDLLGRGPDAARAALARLQPLIALLSIFRQSEASR